jgi:predicted alpha/beta hydrolase family esterase
VVSLAGIADMRAYAATGPKDCVTGELQVMGGTPEQHPARYAAVSPMELLPLGTPQVLVWGTADRIVPQSHFQEYEAKAGAEVIRIEQAGHHELSSAEAPGWQRIVAALRQMLR